MVQTIKFSQFQPANLSNNTNTFVGANSPSGGVNIQYSFPQEWTTSARPNTPVAGTLGYNTSLSQYEYWNGFAWLQLAAGGSGTVSVGTENQLAYYAANGNAVSGLTTLNSAVLTATSLGVPTWVAYTGTGSPVLNTSPTFVTPILGAASATSLAFTSTAGLIGTTTNNNAASGSVGEYIASVIPFASAVSLANETSTDVTSIVLTAGDWDVWGNAFITFGISGASGVVWISSSSATLPDQSLRNGVGVAATGSFNGIGANAPQLRFSIPNTTTLTIYLSVAAEFGSGTATVCGGIYARRRR